MPSAHTSVNRNYVSALTVVDHFLQAWQSEDQEAALLLLTDAAKRQTSPEQLEKMFSPGDTVSRAYQISRWMRASGSRYVFPVTMLEAGQGKSLHVHSSQIVVIQSGKEEWVIDKLP